MGLEWRHKQNVEKAERDQTVRENLNFLIVLATISMVDEDKVTSKEEPNEISKA